MVLTLGGTATHACLHGIGRGAAVHACLPCASTMPSGLDFLINAQECSSARVELQTLPTQAEFKRALDGSARCAQAAYMRCGCRRAYPRRDEAARLCR